MKKSVKEKLLSEFGQEKNETFNFSLIQNYFRKSEDSPSLQIISDKTCADLDFEQLFMNLDRTNSKVGQQYLYKVLRTISKDSDKIKQREILINLFIQKPDFRIQVQELLSQINKNQSYYISSLFQDEHVKPPVWFPIIKLISFTSALSLILMFFNSHLFFVFLAAFIFSIGIHYWNKNNVYQYLVSLPQLLKFQQVAKTLFNNANFKSINPDLEKSIKEIDEIKKGMFLFKLENSVQGDLQSIFWVFLELIKITFLLEPLLLFRSLNRIETKRNEIENIFTFIGEIDVAISVASLRASLANCCQPEIIYQTKIIKAKQVKHPLIKDCVPNNMEVNLKSILLTGSNMSGKTSFIRTIAINVLTGLTINTCFADEFQMPQMKIFSAIRISDDLMNDKSYYFEEVLTIKEMITNSETDIPSLFLLDEIFKGTNTIERIAAGKAVLSYLSKSNHIVFVSTHDIELADLLKDEYDLYHFSESIDDISIDFDYKLKPGKLKNRNAIKILKLNEYPEEVIKEATKIATQLDKENL